MTLCTEEESWSRHTISYISCIYASAPPLQSETHVLTTPSSSQLTSSASKASRCQFYSPLRQLRISTRTLLSTAVTYLSKHPSKEARRWSRLLSWEWLQGSHRMRCRSRNFGRCCMKVVGRPPTFPRIVSIWMPFIIQTPSDRIPYGFSTDQSHSSNQS